MDLVLLVQMFGIVVTLLGNIHALLYERRVTPPKPRLYRCARL